MKRLFVIRQPKPLLLHYAVALACAVSTPLVAAEVDAIVDTNRLITIEVIGSPIIEEANIDSFSFVSSVVTEEQLKNQNALDLAAALRRTPGVQISRFNPVGAFGGGEGGGVYIRGMGASRPGSEIKIYIDGIPYYMGTWNHPLLDLLPLNAMSSITVYKSPQPQISGNNFASVNLITKRATQEGTQGNARLSAGSFSTLIEQVDLVGKQGDWDYTLAQGYAKSDGHRDNADGELNNAMAHLGRTLNTHWSTGINLLYTNNKASDPGDERVAAPSIAPKYNTRATMAAMNLSHQHGTWQGDIRVYRNSGEGNWLDQAVDKDTYTDFEMSGLRWKETVSPWEHGRLVAGIDSDALSGKVREAASSVDFETDTFRINSPYVALNHSFALDSGWTVTPSAGVRYYDHSEFDSTTAPHAGLSLMSETMTLFVNASKGINYPGLETPVLAAYIPPLGTSWQNLEAEELDHTEAGGQFYLSDATQLDVTLFKDKVKNRYVFAFPPTVAPPPQFLNLGEYEMRGAELALTQTISEGWRLFGAVTLLDPSIDELPYTPDRAATLGVSGKIGNISLAVDAQYQSETLALNRTRNPDAVNTEKVSGFSVVNARTAYPMPVLGDRGELFLAVENLFDRDYAYQPGYPMAGRGAQLGVSASF